MQLATCECFQVLGVEEGGFKLKVSSLNAQTWRAILAEATFSLEGNLGPTQVRKHPQKLELPSQVLLWVLVAKELCTQTKFPRFVVPVVLGFYIRQPATKGQQCFGGLIESFCQATIRRALLFGLCTVTEIPSQFVESSSSKF